MIRAKDITDGLSKTYLLGEKYVNADCYYNGIDGGDNQPMFAGYDWDYDRWGGPEPGIKLRAPRPAWRTVDYLRQRIRDFNISLWTFGGTISYVKPVFPAVFPRNDRKSAALPSGP
jgi:hypothetical protein